MTTLGSFRIAILAALALAAITAGGASAQQAGQVLGIAAVVNDDIITARELRNRVDIVLQASNLPDTRATRQRLRPQVLRVLIDEALQLQEAERQRIQISDAEIDAGKALMEQNNRLAAGAYERFLTSRGLDLDSATRQIRAALSWAKLVRRRFATAATVGEQEIREVMERARAETGKPLVRYSEILLTIDDPRHEPTVRGLADKLSQEIAAGGNFVALARQFSKGAGASGGGDAGWMAQSQVPEALQAPMAALQPGETSKPIRSLFGYHLIRLTGRRILNQPNPLDTIVTLKQLFFPFLDRPSAEDIPARLDLARSAVGSARGCEALDRLHRELQAPGSPDLGQLRMGNLAEALRKLIGGLEVGEPSAPVQLPGGIAVFMVCERLEAQPDLPSAEEVRARLEEGKYRTLAQRYLRDLRRAAFIERRL